MTTHRILWKTVHRLLATAACITAEAALATTPVASEVHSWNIPAEEVPGQRCETLECSPAYPSALNRRTSRACASTP